MSFDTRQHFDVYVPILGSPGARLIEPGSGIVGTIEGNDVTLDYEGGRHADNIVTFADRVMHAAGRHAERYPTVARALVPLESAIRVGTYDYHEGEVQLIGDAMLLVIAWLGRGQHHVVLHPELRPSEGNVSPAEREANRQLVAKLRRSGAAIL